MTTFILFAAVLAAAAIAAVVVPLVRKSASAEEPAPITAVIVAVLIMGGGAALYAGLSNWSWQSAPAAADSPQAMVAKLARRLEREPNDLEGWLMLGRSYLALEQLPLAIRAYQRADALAGGKNAEAIIGMAEALTLRDDAELTGRAARLFDRALELDPKSPKALFYGAAASLQQGNLPQARERFVRLLELRPPANVQQILEQQIAAIDQQLGAPAPASTSSAQDVGAQKEETRSAATVRVNVVLSPSVAENVPPDAPLFVIVRNPAQGGPPLAVKRLASKFPQTVELTGADGMMSDRAFSAGQQVLVVARVSRSGGAIASSGDPFGEVRYHVGQDGLVDVVIDKLTP